MERGLLMYLAAVPQTRDDAGYLAILTAARVRRNIALLIREFQYSPGSLHYQKVSCARPFLGVA